MIADLQMARGEVKDGWNLALGEPVVLQKHLSIPRVVLRGPYEYPLMAGQPALIKELRLRYPTGHIVIANGAKQALAATFYAYARRAERTRVFHRFPYWASYPTLARFMGMGFNGINSSPGEDDIHCMTSPNNPDGFQSKESCEVWDAAYASSTYGWYGDDPKHTVKIESAAKLLGISGARIGWLITKEDWIAEEARNYIELTTSGVSVASQALVARALRWIRESNPLPQFQAARDEMCQNGKTFIRLLGDACIKIQGVPNNASGMFAFFQARAPRGFYEAAQSARVALVTGDACGLDNHWFRLNMAQDAQYTEDALKAIRSKL